MLVLEHQPNYGRLIRYERPIGTYLLLWPTLWALWMAADGFPGWKLLLVFTLGTFIMRSAGCAVNDVLDRKVDGYVARTRNRPLPAGDISVQEALGVLLVLLLLAVLLVLQLNARTVLLSLGALVLTLTYPLMKRLHQLPQVYLGMAFSWGIPMAFTAVTGEWPPLMAWLLLLTNVIWTTGYDTMYAICDREDDLKIGVKSTAILFGDHDRLMVALTQVLTLLLLGWIGMLDGMGFWYWLGLAAASGFFVYQHYLIRDRDRWLSLKAFLNNSWVGMMVFLGIALDKL